MSEALHRTIDMEAQPRLMALLVLGLLHAEAGQVSFGIEELHQCNVDYDGVRLILDEATKRLTVRLHRREA